MPIDPVSLHRAAIENVIASSASNSRCAYCPDNHIFGY
jgi:hypothetical protein